MSSLEIHVPAQLGQAGLLGLLARVDLFPPEPPDAVRVWVEDADAWREPAGTLRRSRSKSARHSVRVPRGGA